MSKSYRITSGPSREELFDALRLINEGRTIWFTVIIEGERVAAQAELSSIKSEMANGENWIVETSFVYRHNERSGEKLLPLPLYIAYNSKRRQGRAEQLPL